MITATFIFDAHRLLEEQAADKMYVRLLESLSPGGDEELVKITLHGEFPGSSGIEEQEYEFDVEVGQDRDLGAAVLKAMSDVLKARIAARASRLKELGVSA